MKKLVIGHPCPRGRGQDHPFRRRCSTAAARCGSWGEWTTGMRFWIRIPSSGSGASPSSPSRPSVASGGGPGGHPSGHAGGTWTSPRRWSGRSRCWTVPFWWSAAPTASRPTPGRYGGCWSATACPPSSSSIRWTWRERTVGRCCGAAAAAPQRLHGLWCAAGGAGGGGRRL